MQDAVEAMLFADEYLLRIVDKKHGYLVTIIVGVIIHFVRHIGDLSTIRKQHCMIIVYSMYNRKLYLNERYGMFQTDSNLFPSEHGWLLHCKMIGNQRFNPNGNLHLSFIALYFVLLE